MVLKQIPHASLQGANRSRFAKATCILDRLPRVPPAIRSAAPHERPASDTMARR
jgi:hypothetical protein